VPTHPNFYKRLFKVDCKSNKKKQENDCKIQNGNLLILIGLIFSIATNILAQKTETASNPCLSPEKQTFNFMIGDWQGIERALVNGKMTDVSTSDVQIKPILNNCAIQENWNVKVNLKIVFTAILLRSFDESGKKWLLTYVDDGLNHQFYEGRNESNQWRFFRERIVDGKPVLIRITWSPVSKDSFVQSVERSQDGGQTWELRPTISYRRKKSKKV